MIEEYFRKLQESLLNDKLNLEKDYTRIENQIMETEKFIDLLEEKSDPNFESFTPREVNVKNRSEIKGLLEEKKRLQKEKSNLKIKIEECKSKIEEFQSFLHCVKEEQIKLEQERKSRENLVVDNMEILNYVSCEKEKLLLIMSESILYPIVDMNQKINRIIQFVDIDRERAKLELQQLNEGMLVIEKDMKTIIDKSSVKIEDNSIKQYLVKVAEYYNQENDCDLQIEFNICENTIDYEVPILRTICNLLKKIIEDVVCKISKIRISITSGESMNEFVISMVLANMEDLVVLKNILSNDKGIYVYAQLLSISIDYKYDESRNFSVSFKY